MTSARWITPGRAVALALTLLTLALPAAAMAMHEEGHTPRTPAGRALARDQHRRLALAPARKALAVKRAERRRAAAEAQRAGKPLTSTKAAKPAPKTQDEYGEDEALKLPDVEVGTAQTAAPSGGSFGRTVFGLLIVVGVIYGLSLLLKRMRNGALGGAGKSSGLKAVASIPLGTNRSIHLVRAGQEYLLVGAAEHGVVPLRTYSEHEARDAGLLDLDSANAQATQAVAATVAPLMDRARERGRERAESRRDRRMKRDLSSLLDDLRAKTVRR